MKARQLAVERVAHKTFSSIVPNAEIANGTTVKC